MSDASLAFAARIVLAAVLATSAIAKLRAHVATTSESMQPQMDRLVGKRFAPIIGPVLAPTELTVAVALVAWWSPVPGAVAFGLLAAFTVVLVRAQARHLPCMCFGASSVGEPVGPASIVRNGVLAGLAVLAIGDPAGAGVAGTIVLTALFGVVAAVAVRAAH
jgi:D-serine dehydratase